MTGTPLYVPLMLGEPTATPTQTATASPTSTSPTSTSTATNVPTSIPTQTPTAPPSNCSPAYPTVCIPPPPPDLDCGDIPFRRFQVLAPDPHNFDGSDNDGIGCES